MRFTAVTARGTEEVLARELTALGAQGVAPGRGFVAFEGELADAYRACMFVRSGSRVLMPIASFSTGGPEELYAGVYAIDWAQHLHVDGTLAVDCVTAGSVEGHTRYLAQKTKDAICDLFRAREGRRPSVDRDRPDVRVHVHLGPEHTTVSIDLSGEAMHRRGYRPSERGGYNTAAPLRETLAAALLLMAHWDERANAGEVLLDPMCGSGTFPIEGALMAYDIAPGLLRAHHGMVRWLGHDTDAWRAIVREAEQRAEAGRARMRVDAGAGGKRIHGIDRSELALRAAKDAAKRAGVLDAIDFTVGKLSEAKPHDDRKGLAVVNPPYGERLGAESELVPLYEGLGDVLRQRFGGWSAWVLTGSPLLAKQLGLRASKKVPVWNGPIECRFLEFPISDAPLREGATPGWRKPSAEASPFENRLRKNHKKLEAWAKSENTECYRIYDADIPEYNVAVDVYGTHVVVQEYAAPRSIDPAVAARRLNDVRLVVPEVLGVPRDAVTLKVRRRQVDGAQYQGERDASELSVVHEHGHRFLVSFDDHLDTGLFADQRKLRALAAEAASGKSFLNLFAYTCTASVYAAVAGARHTTNVDLSATYLEWGRKNFVENGLDPAEHRFLREDCVQYIDFARERFDVIFLNPPSYSRSHRMQSDFAVQRDHAQLIFAAMRLLARDGSLFFSTHARDFALDPALARELHVEDLARKCVPLDYRRSPHAAYRIRERDGR